MTSPCTTPAVRPSPAPPVPAARFFAARLPRPAAFAAITAVLVLFTAAASAPSPLYVVYQQEWGFSAATLTVVFAVYVVGLLASLLVLGALSDHVGRRPVLALAITLEAVALVLFMTAGDITLLLLARVIQGIATGAAMTTLGATLVDLNPPHSPGRAGVVNSSAPTSGLALGAIGCGALVQFAPAPTRLVYALLLAGVVLAAGVVAALPETSARRPGGLASLTPRLGCPGPAPSGLLRPYPDHRGQLGARRALPVPRPVRRGQPLRPAQPPDRRPGRHAAVRDRRRHRLRAAGLARGPAAERGRRPAHRRDRGHPGRAARPHRRAGGGRDGRGRAWASAPHSSAPSGRWPGWPPRPSAASCSPSPT